MTPTLSRFIARSYVAEVVFTAKIHGTNNICFRSKADIGRA
jgi:hypothetical protein